MNLEEHKKLAKKLKDNDSRRDKAFEYYIKLDHSDYKLPAELEAFDWIFPVVDHSPHDAIQAGVRVLAGNPIKPTMTPLLDNQASKDTANEIEKNLMWQLKQANRRRTKKVEDDIAKSAILFDAVALMVVDLDWQISQAESLKADTRRMKAARRYGRFVINTFSPRDVHTLRSPYGLEYVSLEQRRLASDVMYEWGDRGGKLKDLAEKGEYVKYHDCMGYDERAVWVTPESGEEEVMELFGPADHELKFFPWVAIMGGSTLEEEEEHRYRPMMYPLYQTKSWEVLNNAMTGAFARTMAMFFGKDILINDQTGEGVDADYTEPERWAYFRGTAQAIPQDQLDPAKMEMVQRLKDDINRATVPAIFQGGGLPAGVPFAGLNLYSQISMGALNPAKHLVESAMAEVYTLMLLWTHYTESPMIGYGGLGNKPTDMGMLYNLDPATIDPENIYITCKIDPQLPIDKMSEANAGMMYQQLGLPKEQILEMVGVDNPQQAMKIARFEDITAFVHEMKKLQQQQQIESEAMMAQQQQQEAAMMAAQEEELANAIPGGQGFNTGQGGQSPLAAFPEATREMMTGEDMMGNEIGTGG